MHSRPGALLGWGDVGPWVCADSSEASWLFPKCHLSAVLSHPVSHRQPHLSSSGPFNGQVNQGRASCPAEVPESSSENQLKTSNTLPPRLAPEGHRAGVADSFAALGSRALLTNLSHVFGEAGHGLFMSEASMTKHLAKDFRSKWAGVTA